MPEPAKVMESRKPAKFPAPLRLVPPADLFRRVEQLRDSIARRAFEIFESDGRMLGRDLANWFKAELELLQPVRMEISESDRDVTVHADVPGFKSGELEICVEPRRLTITGKREAKAEGKEKMILYTERRADQILRVIDLPAAVAAEKAQATFRDGVLELKLPKAPPAKKIAVSVKEPNEDLEC